MQITERIVMVVLTLVLLGGAAWFYFAVNQKQADLRTAVAEGEYEIRETKEEAVVTNETNNDIAASLEKDQWRDYYPELVPLIIASTTVQASVADSLPERIRGLSETPFLPTGVVKLFAFGTEGDHSIWMKDMNYPIDIIWVAKSGKIVHIKENVSPDTYPESFASPKPAWYVIEANAGFVASSSITLGDEVVVPE